jgi:hypothetical protein
VSSTISPDPGSVLPGTGLSYLEGHQPARNDRKAVLPPAIDDHPIPIDSARRDAANRLLGQLDEKLAVEIEKRRLLFHVRDDLVVRVA